MASAKSSYISGGMPIASNLVLYFFNLSSSSRIFDASPMRRRASKYPKARAYGAVSCDWNERGFRDQIGKPTSPAAVAVTPKSAVMGVCCRECLPSTAISNAGKCFQRSYQHTVVLWT